MNRQKRIVIEEVFISTDTEDRKRMFNEILIRIIKKSEIAMAVKGITTWLR